MASNVHRVRANAWSWLLVLTQAGLIFALSAQQTLPRPPGLSSGAESILGHLTVYAMLTAAIWLALPRQTVPRRWRYGLALVGALAYGVFDEWHQSFVPGRDPSLFDLLLDAIGALSALTLLWGIDRRCHGHQDPVRRDEQAGRREHAGPG